MFILTFVFLYYTVLSNRHGYSLELCHFYLFSDSRIQKCSNTVSVYHESAYTPNVGDLSESKLTERQRKILNLIKESPTLTGKQMSEMLSVSQRTIEGDLTAMQKMGVLKHEGKDNDGVWVVLST